MLGKLTRKYMFVGYKWSSFLHCNPYIWDDKSKSLKITYSSFVKWRWYDHFLHDCVAIVWCTLRTAMMYFRSHESFYMMSLYRINALINVGLLIGITCAINLYNNTEEVPSVAYNIINYNTYFNDTYVLGETKKRQEKFSEDTCGLFLAICYYGTIAILILVGIASNFYMEIPILPTSLFKLKDIDLELTWELYAGMHVIQMGFIAEYMMSWFANMYIHAFPGFEYIFSTDFMCQELQLGRKSYETVDALRKPMEFLRNYKSIQLLNVNMMSVYNPLVLPANEWVFLFVSVYAINGFITSKGLPAYVMGLLAAVILFYMSVTFTFFSNINNQSEELLTTWRKSCRSKYMRKKLRSLKPIRVWIGTYYYCDKGMVLNMFKFIFESTVDLLVL